LHIYLSMGIIHFSGPIPDLNRSGVYKRRLSTQDPNHEQRSKRMIKVYHQSLTPFKNKVKVYEKIERDLVLSKEEYDKRRAIGISERNIYGFLEKAMTELGQTNYQLIWLFVKELQAEGQRPWSIYTALYRLRKFALFLKGYGRDLSSSEPFLIKLFLASLPNKVTQHRVAAVLKRFYRFMYENIDEKYKRIYESFKATPPKLRGYPIPQLPDEQEILLLLNHAVQPYKAILALAYGRTSSGYYYEEDLVKRGF